MSVSTYDAFRALLDDTPAARNRPSAIQHEVQQRHRPGTPPRSFSYSRNTRPQLPGLLGAIPSCRNRAAPWHPVYLHFDDIDILPSLAGVTCPSLVIVGEDDFICGPAWNRPIAAAIPAARYVEIADAGHVPQYEQPGAFRAALLDWLATT